MDPNKRFSLDQINKLKRSAPQGMASVDKKPRVAYTSTRGVSGVHPQGPHVAPRRPPTLEPKRFETPLFNIPVQNTSSQIHTQSNNTTSLPLMVRPFVDGSHHNLQQGDILFVKKKAERYLSTVKNIFMLNHHLVTLAKQDVEKALKEAREWMFYGFYRNETNVTNAPMPGTYYPPSQHKNHQSLINVDVFGRSNIINIFGDPEKRTTRCMSGDLVGLALYSSTDDKKVMYLPTHNGTPTFDVSGWTKEDLNIPLGVVTFPKRTGRFSKLENLSQQYNKDNKKMCSMEILIV